MITKADMGPDFGAQTITTTGNLLLGTTPATAGNAVRLSNTGDVTFRNNANTANIYALSKTTGDMLMVGSDTGQDTAKMVTNLQLFANGWVACSPINVPVWQATSTEFTVGKPVTGWQAANSPYGVHGGISHTFASDANYVVTAAQYAYQRLRFITGSWSVGRTVTFPHPATLAAAYGKTIFNNTTVTMTVSTGTGTTVAITTGLKQELWFDSDGVQAAGPTF